MSKTILIIVITIGSTLLIVLFFVYMKYRIRISRIEHEKHRLNGLNIKYNNISRTRVMSIDFSDEVKEEPIKKDCITNAENV
jgi:hypothetical protein